MEAQIIALLNKIDDRQQTMAEDIVYLKTHRSVQEEDIKELKSTIKELEDKTDKMPATFWAKLASLVTLISIIVGVTIRLKGN